MGRWFPRAPLRRFCSEPPVLRCPCHMEGPRGGAQGTTQLSQSFQWSSPGPAGREQPPAVAVTPRFPGAEPGPLLSWVPVPDPSNPRASVRKRLLLSTARFGVLSHVAAGLETSPVALAQSVAQSRRVLRECGMEERVGNHRVPGAPRSGQALQFARPSAK